MKQATGVVVPGAWLGIWGSSARAAVEALPNESRQLGLNLQEPAISMTVDQHWIHGFVMWVCVAIFIVVFIVTLWSIIRHRKSKGQAEPAFHESTAAELVWAIIPFLIIVALAVPAMRMVVL